MYRAKRFFDFIVSFLGIIFLGPLLIVISFLVLINSGYPIIYRQKRLGKNWKVFGLYKFRTMRTGVEKQGYVCKKDDARVTAIGRLLRKYKLDELPQLFNVLKGEMSFVGPRPELPKFASHYSKIYNEILQIRPGITDIAAMKYRNEHALLNDACSDDLERIYLSEILPKKLEYSMEYLKRRNFFYDLKLIFQTISIVVFK